MRTMQPRTLAEATGGQTHAHTGKQKMVNGRRGRGEVGEEKAKEGDRFALEAAATHSKKTTSGGEGKRRVLRTEENNNIRKRGEKGTHIQTDRQTEKGVDTHRTERRARCESIWIGKNARCCACFFCFVFVWALCSLLWKHTAGQLGE